MASVRAVRTRRRLELQEAGVFLRDLIDSTSQLSHHVTHTPTHSDTPQPGQTNPLDVSRLTGRSQSSVTVGQDNPGAGASG